MSNDKYIKYSESHVSQNSLYQKMIYKCHKLELREDQHRVIDQDDFSSGA